MNPTDVTEMTPPPASGFSSTIPPALQPAARKTVERLKEVATQRGSRSPNVSASEALLTSLFAASDFLAQSCLRDPELLTDLLESGDLVRTYGADDYRRQLDTGLLGVRDSDDDLMARLRQLRRREMVRIVWRELTGSAETEDTLRELSLLAETCLDATLEILHLWQSRVLGEPRGPAGDAQQLVVLGMGKLGGWELNFSSDIDLVFALPEEGQTAAPRPLSSTQFFTRLGQRLIRVINETTVDGFVFRVDMRLRPFGDSGPLVMTFTGFENYYLTQGREWERYAMIKARVVAGDREAGERLLSMLRPFVFRRYLDFGAFESLREMKAKIAAQVERKKLHDNIKLGAGGIREIEFIGQAFQLIRGGRETQLQDRSILRVLGLLASHGHLPAPAVAELQRAYLFLRRVENRLQMWADQQTHSLPADELGRERLAFTMGYSNWGRFSMALQENRARVRYHFEQVFRMTGDQDSARQSPSALGGVWREELSNEQAAGKLAALGYRDPGACVARLRQLRNGAFYKSLSHRACARLDKLMPLVLAEAAATGAPEVTLGRLLQLVQTIARRSVYVALLAEHSAVLTKLTELCAASPWVAGFLAQHPLLLDELLDPRALYDLPTRASLEVEAAASLKPVVDPDADPGANPGADLEQQMDALRHFKQVNVLRVVAADIAGELPLMKVSDRLTYIAEAVLAQVYNLVWQAMVSRHGRPACRMAGRWHYPSMAIVAYGKLGGIELGYGSDLDLVFLHDSYGEQQHTDGEVPIENNLFFARLSQKLIHFLNARTSAGVLYEIDTRLRPNGSSGYLVSSLAAYEDYQLNRAWTWEHQALARARVVSGSDALRRRFQRIRAQVLSRARDSQQLRLEVRDMRERMRQELGSHKAARFDLKQDRGGVADIEFMVQYCVLAWAHDHPELLEWTDNVRLLETLARSHLLQVGVAEFLTDTYRDYRARIHRLALLEEESVVELNPALDRIATEVAKCWKQLIEH